MRFVRTEKPDSSARSQIRLISRGMPFVSRCTVSSARVVKPTAPDPPAMASRWATYPRHALPIERLELIADRHALIELAQFGRSQQRLQVQLPDEDDLQQLFLVGLEIRQNADLLEHRQRQVLRLVDDQHGAGLERDQTEQKVVERVDELLLAGAG